MLAKLPPAPPLLRLLLLLPLLCAGSVATGSNLRGLMHRPMYHLLPQGSEAGWISDPNGPIYYKGRYHVFYQAATSAQMRSHCTASSCSFHTPDPISWGHMSSTDLTHWTQHPMAITPAAPNTYEGADVYSGAMIEDPSDGSVKAFYACGCGDAKPPGGHNDAVCYASSSDENLTSWEKFDGPHGSVVLYIPEALGADKSKFLPEAGSQFIFRNATDGSWVMMVGSGLQKKNQMATLLFSATDLKPTTPWVYKGPQFVGGGAHGGAWCPYFARLDPKSDPNIVALAFQNWVARGTLQPPEYRFVPAAVDESSSEDSSWPLLDAGNAHVSAVFVGQEPKGRQNIVMRWLTGAPSCVDIPGGASRNASNETPGHTSISVVAAAAAAAAGRKCDPKMSRACSVDWGWVGVHSLPMTIEKASGAVQNDQGLAYRVVEEVEALRLPQTHAWSYHRGAAPGLAKQEEGQQTLQWHSAARGSVIELLVNISMPSPDSDTGAVTSSCGLVVRATSDGSEQTVISLVSSASGVALVVNRTLSSLSPNQTKTTLQHQLPSAMRGRLDNTVRVFVDKSVLEVFVGDHTILSTRVYPMAGDEANMVGTFTSATGSSACAFAGPLESWRMEEVYGHKSV